MGDLSSTNFGCGCGRNERSSCGCNNGCSGNSCLWIILILLFCGGGNTFGRSGCGCGCNDGCDNSCLWIILILLFCGGGNTFGMNNGCGCGCGCNDGCC